MIELNVIDSAPATNAHIAEVKKNIETVCAKLYTAVADMRQYTTVITPYAEKSIDPVVQVLRKRGETHDKSKLEAPEKEYFDKYTSQLDKIEYNSPEYKECMEGLKPALEHHYQVNSHHPEHYQNGFEGMSLFDRIEMYCDWKAAVKRNKNGDLNKSIEINAKRFNIPSNWVNAFKLQMQEDETPDELVSLNSLSGRLLRYCNGEYVVLDDGRMFMADVDESQPIPTLGRGIDFDTKLQ